jgi:hypothetical protein
VIDPSVEHERARRAIDAHFAGRGSAAEAELLRTHVASCDGCRRRFDRHLLLARLDPRALPEEERLAKALGIARARPRRKWMATVAVAATAVALFVVAPRSLRHHVGAAGDPVARGAGDVAPALLIYRTSADGTAARVVGDSIARDDELAFAYTNPQGRAYLLVFGTDEHGHVYWYHPGWPMGAAAPVAVEARRGLGPHELPEAIRHHLDGHRLRVTAVLSDTRLGAGVVERDGRALSFPPTGVGDVQVIERTFEVSP